MKTSNPLIIAPIMREVYYLRTRNLQRADILHGLFLGPECKVGARQFVEIQGYKDILQYLHNYQTDRYGQPHHRLVFMDDKELYYHYMRAQADEILSECTKFIDVDGDQIMTPEMIDELLNELGEFYRPFIDLIEYHEARPASIAPILAEMEAEHEDSGLEYDRLKIYESRLNAKGYTFEYGLDAAPYNCREIWVHENWMQE